MTTVIREADFVQSLAEAFQYVSYYHPPDYIRPLAAAYKREESPAAKNAIAQILVNSRMSALGHRPVCQDTGMAIVFLKVGQQVVFDTALPVAELVNQAVRQAYTNPDNPLRASMLAEPISRRVNTRDNTPAITHVELVPGDKVEVTILAKGGGSENKARFATLNPSESVADWVVKTVETLGAGWCPPGVLGIGVGGSADTAMLLAKEGLLEPIDMFDLIARGPNSAEDELRLEVYDRVNALGIGAQGLGGLTTVVDVKVKTMASHAASKPVGLIPQCAANRRTSFVLDGSGPAKLEAPDLGLWPEILLDEANLMSRRIDLDTLTPEVVASLKVGESLLLSGKLLTGRDAAHKRLADMKAKGEPFPVDLKGRVIYYVGPVDPKPGEVTGPAGPTTASRMDAFSDLMLGEGLLAMVGKAERTKPAIESIARHHAAYLIAVGGAAYLVSQAIKASRLVAFGDLGMEAIYEFEVKDMPVTVAVDSTGRSIHTEGPAQWRKIIVERRVAEPA